ncbi:hypothetical protein BWQ96_07019 [Gracilariopsis chorda]|uniref:Uncharacterized protein n=1 Tax=Gracilariopsis chorda TaxID=448386 RepID=A0A2V3IMD5_9FLOR|nr:hypothetical protein BWQ96_07019 [Gracilariopsis chorda]|eukprot:PXF43246.1 hypothetical protein BWQ96_07019 [Gracilariopsis chorda]
MHEAPISFINDRKFSNNGIDGAVSEYVSELQGFLGWRCSSVTLFQHQNTSGFNAFIEQMHECTTNQSTGVSSNSCPCDIGIGGWFQNQFRYGKVDFLPPFVHDRYRVATHVSNTDASGEMPFFLKTFDSLSWITIVALTCIFTLLKLLDSRFAVAEPYTPLSGVSRIRRCLHFLWKHPRLYRLRKAGQSSVTRLMLQPDNEVVDNGKSTRQWFLNLVIGICALFLVLSFEASMTASLVQEKITSTYESPEDFRSCKIPPSDVCALRGGALEMFWNTNIATSNCHNGNPIQYLSTYEEIYDGLASGKCKFSICLESVITTQIRTQSCGQLVLLEEPLYTSGLSMVVPKGSNLTEAMSKATMTLLLSQPSSFLESFLRKWPKCTKKVASTLTFRKLKLFFILAFSVCAAILFVMLLGSLYPVKKSANKRAIGRSVDSKSSKTDSGSASESLESMNAT